MGNIWERIGINTKDSKSRKEMENVGEFLKTKGPNAVPEKNVQKDLADEALENSGKNERSKEDIKDTAEFIRANYYGGGN